MADTNRLQKRARSQEKQFSVKTAEVLDLTERGAASVVFIAKRRINNDTSQSEAQELKKSARNSPWTDDKKGQVFANKSTQKSTDDPMKQLKDFIGALSRG